MYAIRSYYEYGILVSRDGPTTTVNATQLLNEIVGALELEALPWEQDRIRLVYRVGGAVISVGDPRNPLSLADIALKKAVITSYSIHYTKLYEGAGRQGRQWPGQAPSQGVQPRRGLGMAGGVGGFE